MTPIQPRFRSIAATCALVLSLGAASALTLVPRAAAADEVADASARADQLVKEGLERGKANDLAGARAKFAEAWSLKHAYDIAANLGLAEAKLEDWVNAANHLDYALRTFPANGKPESKKAITEYLEQAKTRVSVYMVKTVERAEVSVDGVFVGVAPLDAIYVAPGEHTFGAKREGFEPKSKTQKLIAGAAYDVDLVLVEAKPGPGHKDPDPPVTPPPPPPRRTPAPGIVLLGLGVVGVAVGIGSFVAASADADDAEAEAASIRKDGGLCQPLAPGFADRCANVTASADSHNTLQRVGVATSVIGGALAASGLVYLIWPQPKAPEAKVTVVPVVGEAAMGVVVGGAF